MSDESDVIPCGRPIREGAPDVDTRTSPRGGPRWPALSERSDRRRMGAVAPMIPPAKHGGRKRSINVREVLNGIFYVLSTGCQWKALPKDLPPKSTCTTISTCGIGTARWSASITRSISPCASRPDERASPTQRSSTPRAPGGAKRGALLDPSGYDAGKKVKGRKRHILVDTLGLLLNIVVHPADIQDRDGAFHSAASGATHVFLHRADLCRWRVCGPEDGTRRLAHWSLEIKIVKRSDAPRFVVLPKRWIVERTFAWSGSIFRENRRLGKRR